LLAFQSARLDAPFVFDILCPPDKTGAYSYLILTGYYLFHRIIIKIGMFKAQADLNTGIYFRKWGFQICAATQEFPF
jgi:hypothetical protein